MEVLSKYERLNLINQYMILEKLYPEYADSYSLHRKALTEGYELHYKWIYENVWDGLPEDECKKVLDILEMYRNITYSLKELKNQDLNKNLKARFRGFDGNNESPYLAYCSYFIVDLNRYNELSYGEKNPNFNSHCELLPEYLNMLEEWKKMKNPYELKSEAELNILFNNK
jgi:uncharacterized protein